MSNSNYRADFNEGEGLFLPGMKSDTFKDEVQHNFNTKQGDNLTCKNCSDNYERGDLDFHSLCPSCFQAFESQKMVGRLKFVNKQCDIHDYFESSDEWVAYERRES